MEETSNMEQCRLSIILFCQGKMKDSVVSTARLPYLQHLPLYQHRIFYLPSWKLFHVYRMATGQVQSPCRLFPVLTSIADATCLVETKDAQMSSKEVTRTVSVAVIGRVMVIMHAGIWCEFPLSPYLGILCGSCRDGRGVSVLLGHCVTCSNASILLIVALCEVVVCTVSCVQD
jgi:hypothetical protein